MDQMAQQAPITDDEIQAYIMAHAPHFRRQVSDQIQCERADNGITIHRDQILARRSVAFVPHLFTTAPEQLFKPRHHTAFHTPPRTRQAPQAPRAPRKPTFAELQAIDCPWQAKGVPCRYPVQHRPEKGGLGCWYNHTVVAVPAPLPAPLPVPVAAVAEVEATPLPSDAEAIVSEAPSAPLPAPVDAVAEVEATPPPLVAAASVDTAPPVRAVIASKLSLKPKPASSAEDTAAKRASEKPVNKQPRGNVQSAPVPLIEVLDPRDVRKGSCTRFALGGCVAGRCPKNYRHDHIVRPSEAPPAAHRVPAQQPVCKHLKATGRQCGPGCKSPHDPNHVRSRDLVWVPDDNRSPDTDQVIFIRRCEVVGILSKGSCLTFAKTGVCRNRECSYRHNQILP